MRKLHRNDVNKLCGVFENWLARGIADAGNYQFYEFLTTPEQSRILPCDWTRIIVGPDTLVCYDMEPARFEMLSEKLGYPHCNTHLGPPEEDEWGPTRITTWEEKNCPPLTGKSNNQTNYGVMKRHETLRKLNFMASNNRRFLRKWREELYIKHEQDRHNMAGWFKERENEGRIFLECAEQIINELDAAKWIEYDIPYWIFTLLDRKVRHAERITIGPNIYTDLYCSTFTPLGV